MSECEKLGVTEVRPVLCACAVAMARILDSFPGCIPTHPAASKQLTLIMAELHKVARPRSGRLASVQSMAAATTPSG